MSSFIVKPETTDWKALYENTQERLDRAYLERDKRTSLVQEGVMALLGAKTSTELQVIALYGSPGFPSISLDAVTNGNPLEMADAIERQVPGYNDFSGKDVASAIRSLHEKGLIMQLAFGREGSPVVYIEPPYWTGQASNLDRLGKDWDKAHGESRQYTKAERETMFRQILKALAQAKPDELGYCTSIHAGSYESENPMETTQFVRAWWD